MYPYINIHMCIYKYTYIRLRSTFRIEVEHINMGPLGVQRESYFPECGYIRFFFSDI